MLADQIPVDRFRQYRRQIWIYSQLPRVRAVKFLRADRLQTRHELEAEQPAKAERNGALAVGVNILAIDLYWGSISISVQWRTTPSIIDATSEEAGDFSCE